MTMTHSSIFTFLNAYCSPFPVFLKPPVGGAGCEVPSIAACSFNFDYNHLFFFAGVLQDEIYHQNEFFGSLTLLTENHRGVMISAVLPKSYTPT